MNAPAPSRLDRARGALLGLACGDALGVPLISMGRNQAQIRHGTVQRLLGGGLYLLAPGVPTGRVRLARAAAVALLGEAPFAERVLPRYVEVALSGAPGLGESTRAALERVDQGLSPEAAAREAHELLERKSAGIGPALRTVPYALRLGHDVQALAEGVLADARLTHWDARAHAAALALAFWVREHVAGEDDPRRALDRVRERLAERVELPDVLPALGVVEGTPIRATGFAPDVLHAVLRYALHASSAARAIVGAANEAGEASALGAAVGAVVGARFGADALPAAWIDVLEGAATWRRLAERLLDAAG